MFKNIVGWIVKLVMFMVISITIMEATIYWRTSPYLYDVATTIPKNKVGLLLGTSKYTAHSGLNVYYKNRVKAAVDLYKNNRIEYLLVSGDNGSKQYDEPSTFKKDLIKMGIPKDRIILDFAGFRTLDSVIRAHEVFGESHYTIISQPFHNRRAVYIARSKGIEAIAYNANKVSWNYGKKVILRERLARIKMFIDLLMNKQPKYLGEKHLIG